MDITLRTIDDDELELYSSVPIAFMVHSVLALNLKDDGIAGIDLCELPLPVPYLKDYDSTERPADWPKQFDTRNWHRVLAYQDGKVVGAATVVMNAPEIRMLRGQTDLACLWDIRVAPERRKQGVGTELFRDAASWASQQGCRLLQVETQNINVPACRFYRKMGCRLGTIDRYFYFGSECENETCLLWYLPLDPAS